MEPKRILVNSDEYKTKGVFLYADDACNLYLDKEFTCAVTGEQLKDYFLLNAIIVHNGIMHLANNLIFGSKGGAKIAAISSDLVFTSVDFEGEDEVWSLTWDGNTEGLGTTEGFGATLYRISSDPPSGDKPCIHCVAYDKEIAERIEIGALIMSQFQDLPGGGSFGVYRYGIGNGSGSFELLMIIAQNDVDMDGFTFDRGVYVVELPDGAGLRMTALNPYATFEWDGDTEGRVVYDKDLHNDNLYHASDIVPNIAEGDVARCGAAKNNEVMFADCDVELLVEINGAPIYQIATAQSSGVSCLGMILTGDVTDQDSGITYPAGVYLYGGNEMYVSRLDLYKE